MRRIAIVLCGGALGFATLPAAADAALPTGNLLANGGFEQGPTAAYSDTTAPAVPGWTAATPAGRVVRFSEPGTAGRYSSDKAAEAGAGCRTLVGALAPADADDLEPRASGYGLTQTVPLPADAAGKVLRLGALLGRYGATGMPTSDYGAVELVFLDADGAVVGSRTSIGNYSATAATSQELTRHETTTPRVPATATAVRIAARSIAIFSPGRTGSATGLVDDVALTFDGTLPADPPAGCLQAVPTTADATAVETASATLGGTVDTKHEDTRWFVRYGIAGELDTTTAETDLAAAGTPQAVSVPVTGLKPATTYTYVLAARTVIDGVAGGEIRGPVRTFTTDAVQGAVLGTVTTGLQRTALPNDPAKAIRFSTPTRNCIGASTVITVRASDVAERIRPLTDLTVVATAPKRKKRTTSAGRSNLRTGRLRVSDFAHRRAKGKPKARLTLTATALLGAHPGIPGSAETLTLSRTYRFCKAAKKPVKKRR